MARLLAMALNQEPGISFVETLSPVLKPTTIRTLLSLAIARNWLIKELDVQNQSLSSFLTGGGIYEATFWLC